MTIFTNIGRGPGGARLNSGNGGKSFVRPQAEACPLAAQSHRHRLPGGAIEAIKGKTLTFGWKVERKKCHDTDKPAGGLEIDEVWECVEGR